MAGFTKKDYEFFDMARRVALNSDFKGTHLGTVIVYKGRIVSTGYNSKKTHVVQKKYNQKYRTFNKSDKPIRDSLHAEISALVAIPKCVENNIDYSKCKIYIYRVCSGKRLKMGLAYPCSACLKAIEDKGIRKIYYTTDSGFAMEERF